MEELKALQDASISLEQPARDMPEKERPTALLDGTFRGFSQSFASLLRKPDVADPSLTDPPPEAWVEVRKRWPVLAEKTDEELVTALAPIKAVAVDFRQLPAPPWRPPW